MSRILVIDDSLIILDVLKDTLTTHGYEVKLAETADQGRKILTQWTPDLILSDVGLPDVNGIELCRLLRTHAETRHTPIILMTGSVKEQAPGFQAGADDYVMKPFNVEDLVERIRAVMRRCQQSDVARSAPPPAEMAPASVPESSAAADSASLAVVDVPQPAEAMSPAAVEVASASSQFVWGWKAARVLLDPKSMPPQTTYKMLTPAFLITGVLLVNAGLVLAPACAVSNVFASIAMPLLWGLAVSILVIFSSIGNLGLDWEEGAALVSLAALPLLLKLAGGAVFSALTSLSPFLFTIGAGLFMRTDSFLPARFDLFEVWSVALFWLLLRHKEKSDPKMTAAATALVYVGVACAAAALDRAAGR